jgi:ubiquinone/menaquinone biosynthesis C-methylase UbiE
MPPSRPIRTPCSVVATLCGVLLCTSAARAQVGVSPRDAWQRVDAIVAALALHPGDRVADVGAGSGFLSFRLSPVVGADGRVIAVDIDRPSLARLWDAAQEAGLDNIDTVQSQPDDPLLPAGSVDAAVIVNAYHEMTAYAAMLAGIRRALRPDGRLVIVDNRPRDTTASRRVQSARHDIAMEIVAADLAASGFHVIEHVPDFVAEASEGRRRGQWMLVAVPLP